VPDLPLDDGHRELVDVNVMHAVGVTQRMNSELPQPAAQFVIPVFPVQITLPDILLKDLSHTIFRDMICSVILGLEQVAFGLQNPVIPFTHTAILFQQNQDVVHHLVRNVTRPGTICFGIFCRKEDGCVVEIQMLQLNPYQFTHPASGFIRHPYHHFVVETVNAAYEFLPFEQGKRTEIFGLRAGFLEMFHIWVFNPVLTPESGMIIAHFD